MKVSDEYRTDHPEVPWREMIGTRNRVVHDYIRIDNEMIWGIVKENLPVLVRQLTPLVPENRNGSELPR